MAGLIGMPILSKIFGWWPLLPTDWTLVGPTFEWINALRTDPKHQFFFLRCCSVFLKEAFFHQSWFTYRNGSAHKTEPRRWVAL